MAGHGAHDAQLELAAEHEVDDLVAVGHAQAQVDAGVVALELGDQHRQQVLSGAGRSADHHPPAGELTEVHDLDPGLVVEIEDLPGMAVQHLAGVGGRDVASRAVEELGAELALERAHLQAGGRLGDVHELRRQREAALVDNLTEEPQVAEFHNHILCDSSTPRDGSRRIDRRHRVMVGAASIAAAARRWAPASIAAAAPRRGPALTAAAASDGPGAGRHG